MSALKPDTVDKHDLGTTGLPWRSLHVDSLAIGARSTGNNVPTATEVTIGSSSKLANSVPVDVEIHGSLTVHGTTTTIESTSLVVEDPLIKLGKDNVANAMDIGFYGRHLTSGDPIVPGNIVHGATYIITTQGDTDFQSIGASADTVGTVFVADTDSGAASGTGRVKQIEHVGMFRDAVDGKFHLFDSLIKDPTTLVDTADSSYSKASLVVDNLNAASLTLTGASDVTGDFAVNTNKFTIDADNGNTAIAGTLGVTGVSTLSNTLKIVQGVTDGIIFNSDRGSEGDQDAAIIKVLDDDSNENHGVLSWDDGEGSFSFSGSKLNSVLDITVGALGSTTTTISAGDGSISTAGSAPNLTLKQTTAGHSANEPQNSQISFQDHDAKNLAVVKATHEGTSDDSKGQLEFYTNAGTETDEGTLALTISSAQLASFEGAVSVGGTLDMTTGAINNVTSIDLDKITDRANDGIIIEIHDGQAGGLVVEDTNGLDFITCNASTDTITLHQATTLSKTLSVVGAGNGLQSIDLGTDNANDSVINVAARTGTDVAGNKLVLKGGASTGNKAGGSIEFHTAASGAAGDGSRAAALALAIAGDKSATFEGNIVANGQIQSNADLVLRVDADQTSSAGDNKFSFKDGGDNEVASLDEDGKLTITGVSDLDGGIDVNASNFTVATTGAIDTKSTLQVDGNTTLGANNLAASPNLTIIEHTAGATKFQVVGASGNTTVGGTLGVTGLSTLAAVTASGIANLNAGIAVDTDKFTVADGTGNTSIAGTLGVSGVSTFSNDVTVTGDLTVNGTVTKINSRTVEVDDKNIELGHVESIQKTASSDITSGEATVSVSSTAGLIVGQVVTRDSGDGAFDSGAKIQSIDDSTGVITLDKNHTASGSITFTAGGPTDNTADGGGITVVASTNGVGDKTFNYVHSGTSWTSSENLNLASGKVYKIAGTNVLTADTLGEDIATAEGLNAIGSVDGGALTISSPDVKLYDARDGEDPTLSLGSSDTERLVITAKYEGASSQKLNKVIFTTHSTADNEKGQFEFKVDSSTDAIISIDDGGLIVQDDGTIGPASDHDLLTLASADLTIKGALTVDAPSATDNVKFVGSTSDAYLEWDKSEDTLEVRGADDSHGTLLLSTAETVVIANDKLGQISFRAPVDTDGLNSPATGTQIAAAIYAQAASVFDDDELEANLVFATGKDAAATEKMRLDFDGNLSIAGDLIVSGNEIKTGDTTSSITAITLSNNDVTIADQLTIGGKTVFGSTNIELTAIGDTGLTITNTKADTDGTPVVLQLKSEEDAIIANNVIASLEFAAGDSDGGDAALVSAGIHAIAEGTFATDANATKLVFTTAVEETAAASATPKMTLSSTGNLTTAGSITATGSFIVGSVDMDATDLGKLDGISNGTAEAHKAVVLGAGGVIQGIGTIGCGAITSTGTSTFGTAITPAAQGGASLGTVNKEWSHLHLADAATITFGNGAPTVTLTHETSGGLVLSSAIADKPDITIKNANANDKPSSLTIQKKGGGAANGDEIGEILFIGENDATSAEDVVFSRILAKSTKITDGNENGSINFDIKVGDLTGSGDDDFTTALRVEANSGDDGALITLGADGNSDDEISLNADVEMGAGKNIETADAEGYFDWQGGVQYRAITSSTSVTLDRQNHVAKLTASGQKFILPNADVSNHKGQEYILVSSASGNQIQTHSTSHLVYDTDGTELTEGDGLLTMTQNVVYKLIAIDGDWYRM